METIKNGSKGNDVKILQQALGITADGIFGPKTEEVVKKFQKENNLTADGIVGPKTWQVILSHTSETQTVSSGVKSKYHIIFDYGHGKTTSGKRSPAYSTLSKEDQTYFAKYPEFGVDRYYEYLSNRVIGRETARQMRERGWQVHEILTQSEDLTDIGLTVRANRVNAICAKYGANNCVFISFHSNAAGDGKWLTAQGWSAYTTKKQNESDKLATALYDEADKIFKGRKIRKDMSDGDPDWEANFTVIYKTTCPSVLTESFFYDNIDDLKYIVSEVGRDAIIKVHINGIENYLNNK